MYVVLCIDRQIFKLPHFRDTGLPAWHCDVLHLHPLVLVDVGRVVVHHHPILLVVDTDLDLLQLIQDVDLGERHRGVAVDLTGEPQQRDVQPTTPPGPACRHSELSALGLEEGPGGVTEISTRSG